jgi:hypothetical protein
MPSGLASIDDVWQYDVKYMCKYSTTSLIGYFNNIENARSRCSRSAVLGYIRWKKNIQM